MGQFSQWRKLYLPSATSSAQEEKVGTRRYRKNCAVNLAQLSANRLQCVAYSQLIELKQDTCMRKAISPHERRTVTLRFLATGRSYKDLEYTTIESKPALSKIIPETSETLYQALKEDYVKRLQRMVHTQQYVLEMVMTVEVEMIEMFQSAEMKHCQIVLSIYVVVHTHGYLKGHFQKLQRNAWTSQQSLKTSASSLIILGDIDGKHVQIVAPKDSGSYYYDYKKNICRNNGRVSDGGVLSHTRFFEKLINDDLRFLDVQTFHIQTGYLRDGAFAMRLNLIKPYSCESLTDDRRIFNYRLSRAPRVIENTFRIFHAPINLKVKNIETVVLAFCALYNFMTEMPPQTDTPPGYIVTENIARGRVELGEGCDPAMMHNLQRGTRGKLSACAKRVRDSLSQYFNQKDVLESSINN
ncbi:hypothetical protein PR048_014118, partial [Dryococelus australis]